MVLEILISQSGNQLNLLAQRPHQEIHLLGPVMEAMNEILART